MSIVLGAAGPRSFEPSEDLTPAAIEAFLRISGWVQEEVREGVSAIWANYADDASILLPYNTRFRDYGLRLAEALQVIAEVQHIEYGEALELEIAGAVSDILLLRADQATADASIPLREARDLLDGVEKLLLAAACSAIRPRPTISGRKPDVAKEFIEDDVRMGHTLHGSFVITILAKHADQRVEEISPSDLIIREPSGAVVEPTTAVTSSFTRRVMTTLACGLDATRQLLDPNPRIDVTEAVELGVSDELLQSVELMSSHEGLRALDLSFRWSPVQPQLESAVPSRVIVPRVERGHVEEIRRSLRSQPVVQHDSVVGQVVRLERAEGMDYGVVVIDGYLGRTRRRVKVSLSGDAYTTAIHAHGNRHPVIAEGDVVLERRSWWLKGQVVLRRALASEEQS